MAADAAIVTLALSRSGAETGTHNEQTQQTINSTERKRANGTEGNGQSRKQKQVAKAAAKFGAAR